MADPGQIKPNTGRVDLRETDNAIILVYRPYNNPGGLTKSSTEELSAMLDQDKHLRATRMEVRRLQQYVEIERKDVLSKEEQEESQSLPWFHSSLANIKIPLAMKFGQVLLGKRIFLYIVSSEDRTVQDC